MHNEIFKVIKHLILAGIMAANYISNSRQAARRILIFAGICVLISAYAQIELKVVAFSLQNVSEQEIVEAFPGTKGIPCTFSADVSEEASSNISQDSRRLSAVEDNANIFDTGLVNSAQKDEKNLRASKGLEVKQAKTKAESPSGEKHWKDKGGNSDSKNLYGKARANTIDISKNHILGQTGTGSARKGKGDEKGGDGEQGDEKQGGDDEGGDEQKSDRGGNDENPEGYGQDLLYQMLTHASPAHRYLGIGYDMVFGNPLGDPTLMADPGLRAPIYSFQYSQSKEGASNDLSTLEPKGAYSRPFVACKQAETIQEFSTLQDYLHELTTDTSLDAEANFLGAISFSASSGYEKFVQNIKSTEKKTFMLKTYCLRYEAGIAGLDDDLLTYRPSFANTVEALPETMDFKNCPPSKWKANPGSAECKDNTDVKAWIKFFREFGTHVIVHVYAGGKMTHTMKMWKHDIDDLKRDKTDFKVALKAGFEMFSAGFEHSTARSEELRNKLENMDIDATTTVMGGLVPYEFSAAEGMAEWSKSVIDWPMPVKYTLRSIKHMLPNKLKLAYTRAAAYYSLAYGMSAEELLKLLEDPAMTGLNVGTKLKNISQVTNSLGNATCPHGKTIGYGFNSIWHPGTPLGGVSKLCPTGQSVCGREVQTPAMTNFALCGRIEGVTGIMQTKVDMPDEKDPDFQLHCPEGQRLLGGFMLTGTSPSAEEGGTYSADIFNCATGWVECTVPAKMPSRQDRTGFGLCASGKHPGFWDISSHTAISYKGFVEDKPHCPTGSEVVIGFVLGFSMTNTEVHNESTVCKRGYTTCAFENQISRDHSDVYTHFMWFLCAKGSNENPLNAASVASILGFSKAE